MYLLIVQDQSCTDVSVKYRNWQLFPLSTVEKMTLTDSRCVTFFYSCTFMTAEKISPLINQVD